jgi:hypothetical protein
VEPQSPLSATATATVYQTPKRCGAASTPSGPTARIAGRANAVVTVALGVVDLGIALHEYAQKPNAIAERRLVERTVDIALDIGISFIPTVGPTAHFA